MNGPLEAILDGHREGQYVVDAGNLLHLSFLLALFARHAPEMLRQAS